MINKGLMHNGQAAAFIPLVAGSNPARPTTIHHPADDKASSLDTLLKQVSQLSPQEKALLMAATQTAKTSLLSSPSEGIKDWKNYMIARGLAEGTIALYTHTVNCFLKIYPMPTPRDAREYSVMRLEKVTPTKVRNDQKSLRSFFNFLEIEGLWLDNPTKGLQLLKTKKVIRQAPEKEHVDKLLKAWNGQERRLKFRLFILLFVDTGIS